jgi:His/Glu/Gln/Arg/opine family amino acid ABC transporter permease subunit
MSRFITDYWYVYLKGLGVALVISAIGMLISVALGTLGAFGRRSTRRTIRTLTSIYVAVFRALPPLLTLYLVYFGLPTWAINTSIPAVQGILSPLNDRMVAAIVAFAITSGAYSTEILRAAIDAVPEEHLEAARSIGLSKLMTFRRVIAPQALRIAFPPLSNEFIALLKGTSLASVIGVVELMRAAQLAASSTFENLLAYSMAGVYYVVVVILLQVVLGIIERRMPGAPRQRRSLLPPLGRVVVRGA